jgi:hypothetical protein
MPLGVFSERPGVFSERPGVFSGRPGVFFEQLGVFSERPGVFSERPGVFSEQLGVFSGRLGVFSEQPGVFSGRLSFDLERFSFDSEPCVPYGSWQPMGPIRPKVPSSCSGQLGSYRAASFPDGSSLPLSLLGSSFFHKQSPRAGVKGGMHQVSLTGRSLWPATKTLFPLKTRVLTAALSASSTRGAHDRRQPPGSTGYGAGKQQGSLRTGGPQGFRPGITRIKGITPLVHPENPLNRCRT